MGRWQKVYLERKHAVAAGSTTGTVTTDLPEQDHITSINLNLYHENDAQTNSGLIPVFMATEKIEILDGANVIQSLNGAEAQAAAYYRGGTDPCPMRLDWEATETFDTFYMRFGRYDGDPQMMLDCNQLTNPQAKVSYDFVTTVYDGLTYDCPAAPAWKWTCMADVLRGNMPSEYTGKFIRSRRVEDYTQALNTTRRIDIARTEPIYGIMMRGGYAGKDLEGDFHRVRLNINNDEWVPFDIWDDELYCTFNEWWPDAPVVSERMGMINDTRIDSGLGYIIGAQHDIRFGVCLLSHIVSDMGGYPKIQMYTPNDCTAYSADDWPVFWHIKGQFPHHTFYLPMNEVIDGDAYLLDAEAQSRITLELTSDGTCSALATIEVILESAADYTKW